VLFFKVLSRQLEHQGRGDSLQEANQATQDIKVPHIFSKTVKSSRKSPQEGARPQSIGSIPLLDQWARQEKSWYKGHDLPER